MFFAGGSRNLLLIIFLIYIGHFNKMILFRSSKQHIKLFVGKHFCKDVKNGKFELPPEPTTCCMSGCANCVWIQYAETLSKMYSGEETRKLILDKIQDPNLKMFLKMELQHLESRLKDK